MPYKNPDMQKEHNRLYRENHKEWFAAYNRKYRIQNKTKLTSQQKIRYQKNRDDVLSYVKQYTAANKEKIHAYQKEYNKRPGVRENHNLQIQGYRKRDRLLCLGHYSNGKIECACCGENQYEFLTINHINGGGRQHRKSEAYWHIHRWLMSQNFPEGYNVLCWNCNSCLGTHGYCPHKKVTQLVA